MYKASTTRLPRTSHRVPSAAVDVAGGVPEPRHYYYYYYNNCINITATTTTAILGRPGGGILPTNQPIKTIFHK